MVEIWSYPGTRCIVDPPMRELLRELRYAVRLEDTEHDGKYVGPGEYRGIIGKCPDTWNFDGKQCVQVRGGPKKFRIGSFPPEIRDKLRAAAEKGGVGDEPEDDKDDKGEPEKKAAAPKKAKLKLPDNPITREATVAPPGEAYDPDPNADKDKDGVTDSARVGICGTCTAPPADIPRLPNLTADERDAEARFADAFEDKPDALVDEYVRRLNSKDPAERVGDAPNVFSTDDAKLLSPDYNPDSDPAAKLDAKGRYNVVVHQTANAIAKRAFLRKLDELAALPEGDPRRSVLVTAGGVAAGKGYALGNVEETKALAGAVGAVWDSAGEQNGTENPWVLEEAKKRGLKATFVFVDSNPKETWENPKRGVIERARKQGRMVDARVFADSYAIGARNFAAMHAKHKDDKDADFVILSSRAGEPKRVDSMPEEALKQDEDQIYAQSLEAIHAVPNLPPSVKRGGTIGQRIWP